MRDVVSFAAVVSVALCVLLTAAAVGIRWLRWHFLVRRFTTQLLTRDSAAAYLATLPALVTPLCAGELVRIPLLRRRFPLAAGRLARIWLVERCLDGSVLLGVLVAARRPWLGAIVAVLLAAAIWTVVRRALERASIRTVSWTTALAIATSIAAWTLPIAAFALTVRLLATPVGVGAAVGAYAEATLRAGLASFPRGILGSGSPLATALAHVGVPADERGTVALVYGVGTAWFLLFLGLASIAAFRARLARLVRGDADAHFDAIASEYEEEIPVHVRDRLLAKKVGIIEDTLTAHGVPRAARGLDLGCGQGWYLAELCARGYTVDGTDYSTGQLAEARSHVGAAVRDRILLLRADARTLPFADASYDFVYGINAIHHLVSEDAQQRALREIVRVLRPGGVFLLHEINTLNPVFRWYMGYLFPLLKKIDEGNERWLRPGALPAVPGARWTADVRYFTFLPDFVPAPVLRACAPLESALERSRFRRFSAHYEACLAKDDAVRSAPST